MNGCWDTHAQDKMQLFKRPRELHEPQWDHVPEQREGTSKDQKSG